MEEWDRKDTKIKYILENALGDNWYDHMSHTLHIIYAYISFNKLYQYW